MNFQLNAFYHFLKAVRGNWHNAICLKCSRNICPYGQTPLCEGFLMAADAEGIPLLMPIETFRNLTDEAVLLEECRCVLSIPVFETAYSLYLEWHTASPNDCPIRQLCKNAGIWHISQDG